MFKKIQVNSYIPILYLYYILYYILICKDKKN